LDLTPGFVPERDVAASGLASLLPEKVGPQPDGFEQIAVD